MIALGFLSACLSDPDQAEFNTLHGHGQKTLAVLCVFAISALKTGVDSNAEGRRRRDAAEQFEA